MYVSLGFSGSILLTLFGLAYFGVSGTFRLGGVWVPILFENDLPLFALGRGGAGQKKKNQGETGRGRE